MSTPTPILTDASALRERMRAKAIQAIQSSLPLALRNGTLEVHDLKVVEKEFSPVEQYNALMREGTLQEAVKGTLVLKDIEGKVVDTAKNFTLVHVPYLTERHTLVMGGNEYQVANQLRRKPGVYTARADNGELRAIFNLGKGSNFNLGFTPDKGTFHVQIGTSNIPLYPVLRAAGVSHETIAHHLGEGVAKANQTFHGKEEERATSKLYAKLEHPSVMNAALPHAEKVEAIRKKWDVTTLDPHVTEATLGTAYGKVTPEALLVAARKVLDVHTGHKQTDDTDALTYKTFHSLDDFLHERIKLTARAWAPKAKMALTHKTNIREALRPAPFSDGVRKFITTGSLAAVPPAINPLELIDHAVKVTSLGEGGIPSDRAIPLDARMIHATHFGALDPIRTPECVKPDCEVFTETGWKLWPTVTKADKLACNIDGRLEFHTPTRLITEPYTGPLYGVRKGKLTYLVTPNHHVYCAPVDRVYPLQSPSVPLFDRVRADEAHNKQRVFDTGHEAHRGGVLSVFQIPRLEGYSRNVGPIAMDLWASFMGWYIAEGCVGADRGRGAVATYISQSATANPDKRRKIEDLLNQLPFKWGHNETGYRICQKQLARYLQPFGFCDDKYIPEYFFRSPIQARTNLLTALLLGDGRINSQRATGKHYKQQVYCTTSKQLALDVERLIIGLGMPVRISKYVDKREARYLDVFEVRILQNRYRQTVPRKKHHYIEQYSGLVYCATVPGGLLYMRFPGGVAHWTGNSNHSGVDIRATIAAHRDDHGNLYTVATNVKTGKQDFLLAGDLRKHVVAFPGEVLKGTVDAFKGGKVARVAASEVTHQIAHTSHLYSPATTLLPLIHGMQGNRAIMASKMGTQALPLLEREAPFVQSKSHLPGEISFEAMYGHMIAPRAPVSGKVVKIEDGWIYLKPHAAEKKAEDRPVVEKKTLGPFTFHIEIKKGIAHKAEGQTQAKGSSEDYGHLPGYIGPDGDSLDFFVGDRHDGKIYSYEKQKRATPEAPWATTDLKYVVGHSPEEANRFHALMMTYNTPTVRYVQHRNFRDWEHLKEHIDTQHAVTKTAEDRPTVKRRTFGPFTFHIEIKKGEAPFGKPFLNDYGYLPGYVGPDGDSLDFWVGTDKGGAFVSVDTEEQDAKGVWVKRDTKYLVGIPSGEIPAALAQIEQKPKTRCVNRRTYASWEALTKSIERFKDDEDLEEKTAATKGDEGLVKVPFSQNFPFPSKTSLHHTLSVKPGDTVVAGQRMGDSNYTKDGVLALGRNLRVAYVPYYGLNSNDAVVISQGCAEKLTSEHMYREMFAIPVGMEFSKERHQFYYGTKYAPSQYAVLDAHGVVKKGARVHPKDLLVCGLVKTQIIGTDAILGRISKALAKPFQEVALTWNHGTPGEVIDVVRTGSQIAILVKTQEQMQVGDKLCYDEETEILTDVGWKPVADITVADRVASLVGGNALVYVEPSATHAYVQGGRMYSLRTQQLDMLVTDSHKLWVSGRDRGEFALTPAKDVYGRRVRHQKNAQWQGASPTHVVLPALQVKAGQSGKGVRIIPEVRIPTRVFAGLLGAYLSEGNLLDQPESGSYGIEITQIKTPNRAEFLEWLNANDITWTPTGDKFRLHSKQLLEWFRPLGLQPERYIPQEIFQWAKDDLLELFHWLMWGDGTTKGDLPIAYYSSSRRLVDDVQRLCLHIGYAANVHQRRGAEYQTIKGKTYWCRASYEARIVSTKTRPQVNHGHTKQQSAQSEEWVEDYRKPVYGVTVPSGVVYVRRNGKPVWSGNSGRHGNKGVVAKILPDHEMLKDGKGNTIDLLLTSAGVISRINPSQVVETSLGKVVEKTGKPIIFDNNTPRNLEAWASEQLKKHNISDKEHLYDPVLKRHIKGTNGDGVFVGRQFIYKLFKSTDTNFAGHGVGPYDLNEQPLKTGGEDSAKGLGKMEFDALIAHNARNILREAATIKGQKNDEFWRAIQLGLPLPTAKSPFAFKKFVGMLEGAGLKVDQRGSKFRLLPLTDKDIEARSTGAIKKPETLVAKNLRPEPGGLFDARLTGGPQGTLYSHIDLHEPIPHPVFKEPVRRLLGLTEKGFDEKLQTHGGAWFHKELKALDTEQKLKDLHARLKTVKGADLNDTVKQIKYLNALKEHGYTPHEAYVVSKVPVVPPVFRPIIPQPNNPGELMVADANKLYMHLIDSTHTLKNTAVESDLGKHRRQVFNAVASLYGTEDVENDELRGQSVKGFLSNIAGVGTPKGGFFQRKLMKRNQDVSGRGTAVPDPTLGMDQVGIPEPMLWGMYDKLVIARMVRSGYSALDAKEQVQKKTPAAKAALMAEVGERPVMVNRAPTLHRWSIVAAYAVPVQGKTIRVNPFIEKGMNLDFDGDAVFSCVYSRLSETVYRQLTDDGHMLDSVAEADMAARLKEVVGYRTGDHIVRCNLAEFPHAEEVSQREHRTFYRVPPGVEVIALDERTGRLCFAQVSLWSVHRDLKVETVTLASGRQTVTDDDPRAVYGVHPTTLEYVRARPSDSIGMFVPVGHMFSDLDGHTPVDEVSIPSRYMQHDTQNRLRSRVPLTLGVGHFFGVVAGDGWAVDSAKACTQVALASIDESVAAAFAKDLAEIFATPVHLGRTDRMGGDFGPHVQSTKYVCSSMALARWVRDCIGTGARHKHLPPFFFTAPRAFRLGVLAGLLDTDGSISVSRGKKTPQWMINFTSTSLRLCQEVVWLCRSLGVTATTSTSRTPLGDTCWQVTLSTPELHALQEMPCAHAEKARRFNEFFRGPAPRSDLGGYTRQDSVPLPPAVGRALIARYPLETKKLTRKKDPITGDAAERIKANASVNQMLWRSSKEGAISRYTATRCLADHPTLRESNNPLLQRWIRIVDNPAIRWDRVVSFERTGIVEDGYDLTVPGYETFMNVEGVILSNTLQVHAPVTHAAIEDAKKMTLSNMLLSDHTRNRILAFPQHEAIIGFTHASKLPPSNKPVRHFKSMEEAIAAYKRGDIAANDPIEVS